jgi:DNA (cytosine-5)-methyltransferase 1
MKLGSLFDGIGGALLCAVKNGIAPVWASEIEVFPIKVTKYHFPNVKHLGDITKIKGDEIEPVDIIVGGSPCQDLSVAGKRAGMKHADFGDEETTRSGLFMEQIRIIKEMRNGTNKPRYMVWENVPGAFSSNNGEDFRAVLEETARVADPTVSIPRSVNGWANAGSILADGFSISWRTLDAQYWGVPQRRRRIYLVADFGGQSAPEILFESESMPGDFAESGTEGKRAAGDAKGGVTTAGGSDVTSTLFAAYGTKWNGNSGAVTGNHFVLDDAERCTGAAVAYGLVSKGNGEAFLMEEKHMSLSCGGGQAGQGYPAIVERRTDDAVCYNGESITSPTNAQNPKPGDPCHTLGTDTRNYVCFEPRSQDGVPRISSDGLSPTLNTAQGGQRQPCVYTVCSSVGGFMQAETERTPTLMARDYKDPHIVSRQNKRVRRLTPLECERLQGYPDGYTNIPGASDSARYKALGNSFAIPCADFAIRQCKEIFDLQHQRNSSVTIESDNRRKKEGGQNG